MYESVINAYVPRITSLRTERTRPRCQRVIFESIHEMFPPLPLTHTQTLYLSVRRRAQLFTALSESERVKSEKDELCLHRSTARLIPWLPMSASKSAKQLACVTSWGGTEPWGGLSNTAGSNVPLSLSRFARCLNLIRLLALLTFLPFI